MKLIVGLGNPGKTYESTRHNVGFMVVDRIARTENLKFQNGNAVSTVFFALQREKVILAKPKTFMNRSGEALSELLKSNRALAFSDVLVVADDVNLPLGRIRFRSRGSAGGQHGLESIIESLGTSDFARLRIGTGREGLAGEDLTDYVLGDFEKDEAVFLEDVLDRAEKACRDWLIKGSQFVMNHYNQL